MLVDLSGIQIYCEQSGDAEETLVLLHGLGMSCELWRSQIPVFSKYFRTLSVDLRGFGRSGKPEEPNAYKIDTVARDIGELLEKLKIRNCHLLGTSMGGFVAQSLAIKQPLLLKSLVLCHTAPKMSIPEDVLKDRIDALSNLSMKEYGKLVSDQACSESASSELREWVIGMIEKNEKSIYKKVLTEGLSDFNVTASLNILRLPTLIITGENDKVLPAEQGRKIAKLIKGSKIVEIDNVGHLGYAENPESFNKTVLDFLRNL